jgi:hypothetical protein
VGHHGTDTAEFDLQNRDEIRARRVTAVLKLNGRFQCVSMLKASQA